MQEHTHARKRVTEDGSNLVVRMPPPLRQQVRIAAVEAEQTIQDWVADAIRERLEEVKQP